MAKLLYACLLLLFLVPASRANCALNPDPCVLSCLNCPADVKVADPEDCTRYYRCTGSGEGTYYPEPLDCPSGYFDAKAHECSATATCIICPVSCSYECPATLAKIPKRYECNYYKVCNDGTSTLTLQCDSSTPYFDGEKCQDDESQCCHCQTYCSLAQAQTNEKVHDPKDCRHYYTCFKEGTPTDFTKCDDGKYFDESSQRCLSDISCYKPCVNVVGKDGCIDPFTCTDQGYFARCPDQCTPDYYHCSSATDDFVEASSCASGVFHPTNHNCVNINECP